MNVYLLTFLVNLNSIECFLVKINNKKSVLLFNDAMTRIDDTWSVKSMLIKLRDNIIKQDYLSPNKIVCRLLFSYEQLTHHQLIEQKIKLPIVQCSVAELDDYIKAVLTKRNHNNQQSAYDYLIEDSHIQLFFMNLDFVASLQQIFSAFKCEFIGITTQSINQAILTESDISSDKSAEVINNRVIIGVNFLPWRTQKQVIARKQHLLLASLYLVVVSAILLSWFCLIDDQLQQQLTTKQISTVRLAEQNEQYIQLIAQERRNQQQLIQFEQDQAIYSQLVNVVSYLQQLAVIMPKGTWLDRLEWDNHQMLLVGKSFRYSDILQLSEQLEMSSYVLTSQLMVIKQYQYLLQFEIINQLPIKQKPVYATDLF